MFKMTHMHLPQSIPRNTHPTLVSNGWYVFCDFNGKVICSFILIPLELRPGQFADS